MGMVNLKLRNTAVILGRYGTSGALRYIIFVCFFSVLTVLSIS